VHASSLREMETLIHSYLGDAWGQPFRVLDVGSCCVNRSFPHTYREVLSSAWTYVGCDTEAGPNVDLVQLGPYLIQEQGDAYDVILCGQVLEHVEEPWRLMKEMARLMMAGGLLFVTAPWQWEIHRYPLDCWRILPDGMDVLIRLAELQKITTFVNGSDCWGIARKAEPQINTDEH